MSCISPSLGRTGNDFNAFFSWIDMSKVVLGYIVPTTRNVISSRVGKFIDTVIS